MFGGVIGQQYLGFGYFIGDGCCNKVQWFYRSYYGGVGQWYLCE